MSGRQKTIGRSKLESLTDKQLLRLFNNNTIKELGVMFNVDPNAAGKVITSRLFKSSKPQECIETIEQVNYESEGAWMQSKERSYFQENKEDIIRKVITERK